MTNIYFDEKKNSNEYDHLLPFGFATGHYIGKCSSCDCQLFNVDKRARNCVSCATVKYVHSQNEKKKLLLHERATTLLQYVAASDRSRITDAQKYIDAMIHLHPDVRRFVEIALDFDVKLNPVGCRLRELMADLDCYLIKNNDDDVSVIVLGDFIREIYEDKCTISIRSYSRQKGQSIYIASWGENGSDLSCGLIHLIAAAISNEKNTRNMNK